MARVFRRLVEVPTGLALDTRGAHPIFNDSEHRPTDGKRLQRAVDADKGPLAPLCAAVEARLRALGVLCAEHNVHEWALLVSRPGCQRQHYHTDYDPAALADVAPLILLVGLQPGSRLHVDDGLVEFGPGDVVVLRGDAVHAGAAYRRRNVRLHAYADVVGVERAPDTVHLVGQ